jgi:hypothetical protein
MGAEYGGRPAGSIVVFDLVFGRGGLLRDGDCFPCSAVAKALETAVRVVAGMHDGG